MLTMMPTPATMTIRTVRMSKIHCIGLTNVLVSTVISLIGFDRLRHKLFIDVLNKIGAPTNSGGAPPMLAVRISTEVTSR